jgi:leucine dehydrogenase
MITGTSMALFDRMTPLGYEQVVFCHDRDTGLRSIIAIHDTTLGPALGGVRMWPYATEDEALEDCLRLARAMTYKAAAAGLHLGGGKSVIIGDHRTDKTEPLLRAHGRFIQSLGGRYIPGIDVGTEAEDMQVIGREADRVSCDTGDPSKFTAMGVVAGMRSALRALDGEDSLEGKTVAVQGVGHVGRWLSTFLAEEGARVLVADVDPERAASVGAATGAEVVGPDEIVSTPADVFAPCALGDVVNQATLPALKCRVIAGAANNPLAVGMAERVRDAGVLFVPDFLANAGGLIYLEEMLLGHDEEQCAARVRGIGRTVDRVLARSASEGITTVAAAEAIAEDRLQSMRRVGPGFVARRA